MGEINKNLRMRDEHGYTVLHVAVIKLLFWGSANQSKDIEYIESLISKDPVLVDIKDIQGLTPLCYAKNAGHNLLIGMMSQQELQPEPQQELKQEAQKELQTEPKPEPQLQLQNNEVTLTSIVADLIPKVVGNGVTDMRAKGFKLKQSLNKAAELKGEAEVNAAYLFTSLINGKESADLHYATSTGNLPEVTKLIEEGSYDVNSTTPVRNTPLHIAAKKGNLDIVKYLISKGGGVELTNAIKNTPLNLAVKSGDLEVVQCLLDAGANKDATNLIGNTPLSLANGNYAMCMLVKGDAELGETPQGSFDEGYTEYSANGILHNQYNPVEL